jgi:8-oxo-dGTP pyrophosphatase MutT (NUDIX family)
MLEFISQYQNCFERSLEIGHLTGSAWLVNQVNAHALLTHHAKLNKWIQLGGHCDGDPDVLAVAIKEAQEESGIKNIVPISTDIFDLDIHVFPETAHNKEHLHYDVRFLLQVVGNETIVQNHESKELRWISKKRSELPTSRPAVTRMFDKWLERCSVK